MAQDQRYCLECGQRRGDPRLPFMDAVVFMEASRQPELAAATAAPAPVPSEPRPRISNNAALVAGVATLVLAIGVGVLIGRSGDSGSQPAASAAPQVIQVGGGEEATVSTGGGSTSKAKSGGGSSKSKKKAAKEEESIETGASGTSKAAEEVLKPSADAKPLPEATTELGDKCKEGTAGCENGEFNGNFFGE